ncbi:hypothetical protein G210_3770, partial [Candida maltosa Xu316]
MEYDIRNDLDKIFTSPDTLNELPQLLSHVSQYKLQLSQEINQSVSQYKSVELSDDIINLVNTIKEVKKDSQITKESISLMTSSIQKLDQYKKNLVTSMTVLKRLQMLINVNNTLSSIISSHNYKEIYQLLGVMKELLQFFQPYKSINEINQINLMIVHTQNKLIDDIFIDFEEFTNKDEEQLLYGAKILELIDVKYKEKLLTWFYNFQLRDLREVFSGEAGSLDNLNRRFLYFKNILKQVQQYKIFPWDVSGEIIKEFCKMTKQDISKLLYNTKVESKSLLDNLTTTLEFEKSLNLKNDISSAFEPYLSIWVHEQDNYLSSKILEFSATSQLPPELKDVSSNVPNIAVTSTELFKIFNRLLSHISKLTDGETIVDLTKLFNRYLFEYNNKILLPILATEDYSVDSIKYFTMLLNTGDYMIGNIEELSTKIKKFTKLTVPELNTEIFYQLINKSMSSLLMKMSVDFKPCWREFFNIDWSQLDSVNDISSYMTDLKTKISDNLKIILPLIIRDSYVRNFSDKLVELLITTIANNLKYVKPLQTSSVEQISMDVYSLKELALKFPLYSAKEVSKSYIKFVNNHFHDLESLLKLLMVPTVPVENIIESYFELIGDKSISNFTKVLNLKKVDRASQHKYIENFKLQLSIDDGTVTSCALLQNLEDEEEPSRAATPDIKLNERFETHVNKINENFKNFISISPMKVVKICGIKTFDAATVAVDNEANLLGCILVPNRERTIDFEEAKKISKLVKRKSRQPFKFTAQTPTEHFENVSQWIIENGPFLVGVFRNQSKDEVFRIARELDLDFIQLHGSEDKLSFINDEFGVIARYVVPNEIELLKEQSTSWMKCISMPLLDSEVGGEEE